MASQNDKRIPPKGLAVEISTVSAIRSEEAQYCPGLPRTELPRKLIDYIVILFSVSMKSQTNRLQSTINRFLS